MEEADNEPAHPGSRGQRVVNGCCVVCVYRYLYSVNVISGRRQHLFC